MGELIGVIGAGTMGNGIAQTAAASGFDVVLVDIEQGLVDPNSGEGFHGMIAFDLTGDGIADASTWFGVGPDGEIPLVAQFKGPACKGLTNIGIYLTQCVGG